MRLAQPELELFRLLLVIVGLLVALTPLALALTGGFDPPMPWWLTVCALLALAFLVACVAIRYLANLSRIMAVAAWSDEGADRVRRDMAVGMRNGAAYEQLIELYEPIRAAANTTLDPKHRLEPVELRSTRSAQPNRYAAVVIPAGDGDTLESLIGDQIAERDHTCFRLLADSRQQLMRKWRAMGSKDERELEDERGDNYCLTELRSDGGLRLEVGVATYGEIVRSCDSLINEFALYAFLAGPYATRRRLSIRPRRTLRMSPAAMLHCLPWRHRIHRDSRARPRDIRRHRRSHPDSPTPAGRLFLNPEDRAAGVGVAVVTVEETPDGERFYLGMRSGVVGTYPSTHHVIPAGMCNTYGTDLTARSNKEPPSAHYLSTAMKCEFIEEWFSVEEFENNRRRGWERLVNDRWREEMATTDGDWREPELTGIAFDLLNLRPEVCAVAVVKTESGVLNWEFEAIGFEGSISDVGTIGPTEIVQSGAAALWLLDKSRGGSNIATAER